MPGKDEVGYQDVTTEHSDAPCNIRGVLPPFVNGTLYDHCGGAFVGGGDIDLALLDGLAHVARWRLSPEGCFFSNRFIDSDYYRLWKEMGVRLWGGTAMDTEATNRSSRMKEIAAKAVVTELNANVSFWRIRSQIAAASEYPQGYCALLDDSCNTVKGVKPLPGADPSLPEGLTFTTAAHYLESSGEGDYHVAHFMSMQKGFPPSFSLGYRIYRGRDGEQFDKVGELTMANFKWTSRDSVPIPQRPSYMHSICETTNYVVLLGSSVRLDPKKLVDQDFSKGFFNIFKYEETQPMKFHVFRKCQDASLEHAIDCNAEVDGHTFHVVNCFENPSGEVVCDVTYERKWLMDSRDVEQGCIMRFVLDINAGRAANEKLTSAPQEFACVNPMFFGKSNYRYIYGLTWEESVKDSKAKLFKFDLRTQVATPASNVDKKPLWATEPQFVPDGSGDEDGGVVICPCTDSDEPSSFLLVLDPRTMEEVARISAPMILNDGLHNLFVPEASSTSAPYLLKF